MAIIPTLLAVSIGLGLGLRWGGQIDNLTSWRPPLLYVLAGGVSLTILIDVLPLSGGFMTLLSLIAMGMLMAFAFVNIRTGGMVLILVGVGLNFVVTLLNWGTPVSAARWSPPASCRPTKPHGWCSTAGGRSRVVRSSASWAT